MSSFKDLLELNGIYDPELIESLRNWCFSDYDLEEMPYSREVEYRRWKGLKTTHMKTESIERLLHRIWFMGYDIKKRETL